ncbi:MAG: beta-lactamase domain protein [Gemmatimonadetes bacterium]|nr:beta-lactamase domain protein [Gemmatimonadota bacterium]
MSRAARALSSLLSLAALAHVARAQAPRESVLSFRTVQVAEGVFAFITPEERSGFQAGNSVAIIGDSSVLVFDTGNLPSATRAEIAALRKLTPRPVRYVVNSHWHPDHNLGNAEYRAAFPGVTIIGTKATRDGIRDFVPRYIEEMRGFHVQDSLMRLRLSTGNMRDGTPMPDNVRTMWGIVTQDYALFMPEVNSAKPTPSNLVFSDSMTIDLGNREVRIVSLGRGNTAGDAFIWVPASRTLLTGDLVTLPAPFPGTSFFADWIRDLDLLHRYGAQAIVPGHGDVQHDYAYVDMVHDLLVFTLEGARAAVRRGETAEQAEKAIDFSEWEKRFGGGDLVRTDSFGSFYSKQVVPRAWEQAKAESERALPPGG